MVYGKVRFDVSLTDFRFNRWKIQCISYVVPVTIVRKSLLSNCCNLTNVEIYNSKYNGDPYNKAQKLAISTAESILCWIKLVRHIIYSHYNGLGFGKIFTNLLCKRDSLNCTLIVTPICFTVFYGQEIQSIFDLSIKGRRVISVSLRMVIFSQQRISYFVTESLIVREINGIWEVNDECHEG